MLQGAPGFGQARVRTRCVGRPPQVPRVRTRHLPYAQEPRYAPKRIAALCVLITGLVVMPLSLTLIFMPV